jgi:hypothetical protein
MSSWLESAVVGAWLWSTRSGPREASDESVLGEQHLNGHSARYTMVNRRGNLFSLHWCTSKAFSVIFHTHAAVQREMIPTRL